MAAAEVVVFYESPLEELGVETGDLRGFEVDRFVFVRLECSSTSETPSPENAAAAAKGSENLLFRRGTWSIIIDKEGTRRIGVLLPELRFGELLPDVRLSGAHVTTRSGRRPINKRKLDCSESKEARISD